MAAAAPFMPNYGRVIKRELGIVEPQPLTVTWSWDQMVALIAKNELTITQLAGIKRLLSVLQGRRDWEPRDELYKIERNESSEKLQRPYLTAYIHENLGDENVRKDVSQLAKNVENFIHDIQNRTQAEALIEKKALKRESMEFAILKQYLPYDVPSNIVLFYLYKNNSPVTREHRQLALENIICKPAKKRVLEI